MARSIVLAACERRQEEVETSAVLASRCHEALCPAVKAQADAFRETTKGKEFDPRDAAAGRGFAGQARGAAAMSQSTG